MKLSDLEELCREYREWHPDENPEVVFKYEYQEIAIECAFARLKLPEAPARILLHGT